MCIPIYNVLFQTKCTFSRKKSERLKVALMECRCRCYLCISFSVVIFKGTINADNTYETRNIGMFFYNNLGKQVRTTNSIKSALVYNIHLLPGFLVNLDLPCILTRLVKHSIFVIVLLLSIPLKHQLKKIWLSKEGLCIFYSSL